MKKIILAIVLSLFLLIGGTGCGKEVSEEELNDVNNQIIKYFTDEEVVYDNLSFNYVDLTNKKVVVGLLDNSKEQQKKFKEMVVDSKYVEFVQGESLKDLEDYSI